MVSIWQNDGTTWKLLSPKGFSSESTLHSLIENAPRMLPLSGDPRLVIVGREVYLNGNYADLIGIEPDGRLSVIEVKLSTNAEARRAVVAQVLTYAASLSRLDRGYLEQTLLAAYLKPRGFESLLEAVTSEDQTGQIEATRFNDAVDDNLGSGSFRLVLVLDAAPPELVRLVGYLGSVTERLIIDLITVSSFDVKGSQIVVPSRIDPAIDEVRSVASPNDHHKKPSSFSAIASDGSEIFVKMIERAPVEKRADLHLLADWAGMLSAEGLVEISTTQGVDRWVLNLRIPGDVVGLVSIYNQKGASITLYRSVFEKRAPGSIAHVEQALAPKMLGQGNSTADISQGLLNALADAYREAKGGIISATTLE